MSSLKKVKDVWKSKAAWLSMPDTRIMWSSDPSIAVIIDNAAVFGYLQQLPSFVLLWILRQHFLHACTKPNERNDAMLLAVFEEHLVELFFVQRELSLVQAFEATGANLRVSNFRIFMKAISFEQREYLFFTLLLDTARWSDVHCSLYPNVFRTCIALNSRAFSSVFFCESSTRLASLLRWFFL